MATFSHSKVLFVDDDGNPMQFYMAPGTTRLKLRPYIEYGGGIISNKDNGDDVIKLATTGQTMKSDGYVHSKFIMECVEVNKMLDIDTYRLKKGDVCESSDDEWLNDPNDLIIHGEARSKKGRSKYFHEDDMAIIQYLLDGAMYENVKGNKVWAQMEKENVVKGRTWQSLKHRYLKTIIPNLHHYHLSNQDVTRLTAVIDLSGSNEEESPRKPLSSLFSKKRKTETRTTPEKSPSKKSRQCETEDEKKNTPAVSKATPKKTQEATVDQQCHEILLEESGEELDDFDVQLLQQAVGVNIKKSDRKSSSRLTRSNRKPSAKDSDDESVTDSRKSRRWKKTSDLSKVKNKKDEGNNDVDVGKDDDEGGDEQEENSQQESLDGQCDKSEGDRGEDTSSLPKRLSLRSAHNYCSVVESTEEECSESQTDKVPQVRQSSRLKEAASTERVAEFARTLIDTRLKLTPGTAKPKDSPATGSPRRRGRPRKTPIQPNNNGPSHREGPQDGPHSVEPILQLEGNSTTTTSEENLNSSAQSLQDVFPAASNEVTIISHDETLQEFIMGGEANSGPLDPEMHQQGLETIKTVCSCLELPPAYLLETLYAVNGDLQEAIHWILHNKTKGTHYWTKQEDDLLQNKEEKLNRNYCTHFWIKQHDRYLRRGREKVIRKKLARRVTVEEVTKRKQFLGLK